MKSKVAFSSFWGISVALLGLLPCLSFAEPISSNDEFVVYTSQRGQKFYQFDFLPRNFKESQKHCEQNGMRTPSEEDFQELSAELQSDGARLKLWLGRDWEASYWSSEMVMERAFDAWGLYAAADGVVYVGYGDMSGAYHVRCVEK